MRLFTIQALLICFSSIQCVKYCAEAKINPNHIFDWKEKKRVDIEYKKVDKNESYCYVSFYSESMPENLNVKKISDCSKHFKGEVKAGTLEKVPETIKKNRCYYQHNWIICVCSFTYCNSPQYWPLMLARFSHDNASETREMSGVFKDAKTINEKAKTNVKVNEKTKDSYGYRENLRCLVWYSDTLSLEEPNPKFYLYNYITTLRRAPLLADALTTPPVEKKANDSDVTEYTQARKLYVTEKEPYKDGTHENDEDYRTFHFEVKQDRLNNGKSFIMAIGGTISFLILLAITIAFLVVLCQKVQDHSSFSRSDDIRAQRRFDRCFKSPQLPKEFIKKNYEERKKTDVEAGPSIK